MFKQIALLSLLVTIFVISGCQSTSVNPVNVPITGQESVRTTPVNVLDEFIKPQAITPQAVDIANGNIFDNGGFETSLTGWNACDPAAMQPSNDAYEGNTALKLNAGHCFYRSAEVTAGQDLVLSCYAKLLSGSAWTGMGMGFSDANRTEISQAPVAVISGTSYARFDSMATAPANATYVSMWFYTDNPVVVDNCTLMLEVAPPEPEPTSGNLLNNSGFFYVDPDQPSIPFEWLVGCGGTAGRTPNNNIGIPITAYLKDGACLDQSLNANDISALKSNDFTFACKVNNTGSYASMSIFLDGVAESKVIQPTQGFLTVELTRTAPAQLSNGFVSLYSEGTLNVESCSLTVNGAPEPQPDNLLQNGSFDATDSGWNSCSPNSLNIPNGSLLVSNGDCIYQTVPATSGGSYQLQCEARATQTGWNNIILDFLDANWQSTGDKSYILVRNQDLRDYAINLNTPTNAAHVAVSFYAEGQISVDSCILKNSTTTLTDANTLLQNGSFEAGSIGMDGRCSQSYTSDATKVRSGIQAVELTNSSDCLEYTFTGLTPGNYTFSCYYSVQSEFLVSGPNAAWAYRTYFNAGTSGANVLLPIDQLDSYRLHTINPIVNDSGKITLGFSGQGLLFDDCSFAAR